MNAAKLHIIYSLLLAHCFSLAPEDEAAVTKYWGSAYRTDQLVEWPNFPASLLVELLPNRGREMSLAETRQWIKEHPELTGGFGKPFRDPAPLKICSIPSELEKLSAASDLAELFDLEGVPGFYRDDCSLPGPQGSLRRETTAEFGPWRLHIPTARAMPSGLLCPYDNGTPYIVGIRMYRNVRDRKPFLLTSRGLPGGARAVSCQEVAAA